MGGLKCDNGRVSVSAMNSILSLVLAVLGTSAAVASNAADEEFLVTYAAQPDAIALPSGLSYKVVKQGQGGKPSPDSSCKCNYEGRLSSNFPDGKTFDSSYKRGAPSTFKPTQVIKCWTEAMQLMPVGSKWELVCPPEIAYGSRVMGSDIPANSVLVFTMELLECQGVAANLTESGTNPGTNPTASDDDTTPPLFWLPATLAYAVLLVALVCIAATYCFYKNKHRYVMLSPNGVEEDTQQCEVSESSGSVTSPGSQFKPMEDALHEQIDLEMTKPSMFIIEDELEAV